MLSKHQCSESDISNLKFMHRGFFQIEDACLLFPALTNAMKNRATTLEDLTKLCCIQDFLTAIRSAKWLPAESMPMKSSTGPSGRGGACHLGNFSRCNWGAKLGCDAGKEAANTECTSMSPFTNRPVASSRTNPCQHYKQFWDDPSQHQHHNTRRGFMRELTVR